MEHSYNDLLITFGTVYKNLNLEHGWPEWRAIFEALLRTMSWYNANVNLDIESFGRCHFTWQQDMWHHTDYEWPKDMQRASADMREVSRNPVERWTFSGGPEDDPEHSA